MTIGFVSSQIVLNGDLESDVVPDEHVTEAFIDEIFLIS
jgi:hypothetical protein